MTSTAFQQIVYRWTPRCPFDAEAGYEFWPVSWSYDALAALRMWDRRVRPWLRTAAKGTPSPSLFYTVFDDDAVLIRRDQQGGVTGAVAHLLIGPRDELTPMLALELRALDPRALDPTDRRIELDRLRWQCHALTAEARLSETGRLLGPVLSQVLAGPRTLVLPGTASTHGLLAALLEILSVLGTGLPHAESWPLSFETYDDRPQSAERPGLFLRFRDDVPLISWNPSHKSVAARLADVYTRDGPDGLRLMLSRAQVLRGRSMPERVELMTGNPAPVPPPRPPTSGATMSSPPPSPADSPAPAEPDGEEVSCPVCLGRLRWGDLEYFRYDIGLDENVPLTLSPDANAEQRARELRNAIVRCPNPGGTTEDHYLPAGYGSYGPPAVFGFVGASQSGKTHLLVSMIAAIEQGGLVPYGLGHHPIDLGRHQRVLRELVRPLMNDGHRIASTRQGVVQFLDGFVIRGAGRPRPMALFDVAGSELTDVDNAKRFLDLADGLVFVVDPDQFAQERLGDVTFGTVLDLLRDSGRLPRVSAAVVLAKADLLKFEDPVALWLRHTAETVDAADFLEESADVYAYLHQQGARAWARPFDECPKATLHVASALGSDSLERGVRPQRVLRPLVALMAMSGLITVGEAATVGV